MYKDDLAYYAGFFDGEGCIMINKSHHALEVRITQTNRSVLWDFKNMFGGYVYDAIKTKEWCKPKWQWVIGSKKAAIFLKAIYPYLRLKDKEAQLAMEFQDYKDKKHSSNNILLKGGVDAVEEAQRLLMRNLKK